MQRIHKTVATESRSIRSEPQCISYCICEISLHECLVAVQKLCKKWKDILKIGKPITKYMLVCSKHILDADFIIGKYNYCKNIF